MIKHYLEAHITEPEDSARRIAKAIIAPDQNRGQLMRWQSRFEPLDTTLNEIGLASGMGYFAKLSIKDEIIVFDVAGPADKTINSESPVIFSTEFDNIQSMKYVRNITNYINAGYTAGTGEDENRLILTLYPDGTNPGWKRYESFIDCGNIDNLEDLTYEGNYKMKDKVRVNTLSGEIINTGSFVYMEDYDLGDIVTLQSARLGVETDSQITEVRESYEANGMKCTLTFGKRQNNILDEIRKIGVVK